MSVLRNKGPDANFDGWFHMTIVKPTIDSWGAGWERLSDEMQREAVQAALFRNITHSDRLDRIRDQYTEADAAAMGRHVAALVGAYERWTAARDGR